MDKSCQSSAESTNNTTTATATTSSNFSNANHSSRDQYLRQFNKISQKISKPIIKRPTFDSSQNQQQQQNHTFNNPNLQQPPPPPSQVQEQAQQQQNLQHQPPVYNINKNDFRDVVQKLTGSPAHERISTPPPILQPKQPSSRLQRIRPPPLAQISNRPPPLLNDALPRPQPPPTMNAAASAIPSNPVNAVSVNNFSGFGRPGAPLSPLPPFPTVHAAAESPVSAYMRYLHNPMSAMDSNSKQFSGFSPLAPLVSPRWNNFAPQQPLQEQQLQPQPPPQSQLPATQQGIQPSQPSATVQSQSQCQMPSSPVPFGCLNSPRSSFPFLSPVFADFGSNRVSQLPLSPTVPVPSPRWRAI